MTNIKVPIGRGVAQFIPEEFQKKPKTNSSAEFLEDKANRGRIRTASATVTADGEVTSLTAANGETLFLTKASWAIASGNTGANRTVTLNVGGTAIIEKFGRFATTTDGIFDIDIESISGDAPTPTITITCDVDEGATISGSIHGYVESTIDSRA